MCKGRNFPPQLQSFSLKLRRFFRFGAAKIRHAPVLPQISRPLFFVANLNDFPANLQNTLPNLQNHRSNLADTLLNLGKGRIFRQTLKFPLTFFDVFFF